MKIKNLKTNEVKDVKEVAEEIGIDYHKICDNIRKDKEINGVKYIKWNEPEPVKEEEPVQEEAVEIGSTEPTIYNWVEVVNIKSKYGEIIGEKIPFSGEVRARIPLELLQKEGFKQLEKVRKFVCDEAKKVEIKVNGGQTIQPKEYIRKVSNRLYNETFIRSQWVAPVGGSDKVQIIETGEIITLKHAKQDPRYNNVDRMLDNVMKKEKADFLDLNEIKLD